MDFLQSPHIVKARKPHKCDWCNAVISIGDSYRDSVIKNDEVYHWRECLKCAFLADEMFRDPDYHDNWGDGYTVDQIEEFCQERYGVHIRDFQVGMIEPGGAG